jgi:glycosyltransferase involved in cell wall biosynthesis
MRKPLVSHIIIAYQQERYIEEAVLSAASQDYDDLEVIVADDGSTDDTAKLIKALAARFPGRVVHTSGSNLGVTGNSNRGLRAARGSLVSFQGGDDVLLPGKVRKQVEWFERHPSAVLCGHPVENFFEGSTRAPELSAPQVTGGSGAAYFIENGPPFAATSVMVRASAIPSRGFDERLPLVSDWKLWIDVLSAGGSFGLVSETLARYRVHSENVSTKRRDRMDHDSFYTLALVDLEHPQYSAAARRGRAMLNAKRAALAWEAADYEHARQFLTASFLQRPQLRALGRLVACSLPAPTLDALRSVWARRRQR